MHSGSDGDSDSDGDIGREEQSRRTDFKRAMVGLRAALRVNKELSKGEQRLWARWRDTVNYACEEEDLFRPSSSQYLSLCGDLFRLASLYSGPTGINMTRPVCLRHWLHAVPN